MVTRFDRLQQTEGNNRYLWGNTKIAPTTTEALGYFKEANRLIMNDLTRLLFSRHGLFETPDQAQKWFDTKAGTHERTALLSRAKSLPEPYRTEWLQRLNDPAFRTRLSNRAAVGTIVAMNGDKVAVGLDQSIRNTLSGVISGTMVRQTFAIQKGLRIGWDVSQPSNKMIEKVMNRAYDASSTVPIVQRWGSEVKSVLTAGISSGADRATIVKTLSERTGESVWEVKRLVRTEITHASAQAELATLEEHGLTKYRFMATLDERTCDICGPLDGRVFLIKDSVPGGLENEDANTPPIHPNCRCVVTAAMTTEALQNIKRRHRDPATGKNQLISGDITWSDWVKTFLS
jgi:SPP1 gp7 family putative phage head morphogenesis protein